MKTMLDAWNYLGQIIAEKNTYRNGYWGMFYNGVQAFDCVCSIKACAWEVPIGKDITSNKYDYIANHKAEMPDVSIATFYSKASTKSTDMSKIPTDRLSFVYQANNGHIGIYNPATGTTREVCAGSVMGGREAKLSESNYWGKWSTGSPYFTDSVIAKTTTSTSSASTEDYSKNTTSNRFKVLVGGKQTGAYTVYANAKKSADNSSGIIIDSLTGKKIYPVEVESTTVSASSTTTIVLTASSYPNYTDGSVYRVRKSFKDERSSGGSFSVWKNAYTRWACLKASGYHIYDKGGNQLD